MLALVIFFLLFFLLRLGGCLILCEVQSVAGYEASGVYINVQIQEVLFVGTLPEHKHGIKLCPLCTCVTCIWYHYKQQKHLETNKLASRYQVFF